MFFYSAKTSKILTRYSPVPNIPINVTKSEVFQQEFLKMKEKERLGAVFNGSSMVVNGIEFSDYAREILIELAKSDYFTSQSLSAYNQANSDEITDFKGSPTGNFGACTFLISNDSKLIIAKRSDRCISYPGVSAFCFGEGANYDDLKDLRLISTRCLYEELDLTVPVAFVEVCGLFFDDLRKTWALASLVDLRDKGKNFDAENIVRLAKCAEDAWENEALTGLSISHCNSLLRFTKKDHPYNKLLPLMLKQNQRM